jgi:hypothetical protein
MNEKGPFGPPLTTKEVGAMIRRSREWVADQCRKKKIPTCPPHRPPYLIPRKVLFKFGVET